VAGRAQTSEAPGSATADDPAGVAPTTDGTVISEERLRRLADAMPQIVWITRPDHTVEYFNARWVSYTGMSLEEALALPGEISELVHIDDRPGIAHSWQRANTGPAPAACEFEYRLRRHDGVYRWHLARLEPTDLGDGDVRWVGSAIDIDERKRAEQERRAQDEQTRRLHEMFLAVVSHDLRNPLSSIVTTASYLEKRGNDPPMLMRIRSAAQRMNRLVDQLLDFESNRLAGGMPIHREEADLKAICEAILDEVRGAGPDAPELRLAASGVTSGHWDADRLGQAVSNLVVNALQHGRRDRPVDVRIAADGDPVELSVTNEGPPIAPDLLPVLFDPFRRADRNVAARHGVGLGLYIVNEIVLRHGGSIAVVSDDERTRFTLRLPRSVPVLATVSARPHRA
jgi:PAS domain S-box-containing protein